MKLGNGGGSRLKREENWEVLAHGGRVAKLNFIRHRTTHLESKAKLFTEQDWASLASFFTTYFYPEHDITR